MPERKEGDPGGKRVKGSLGQYLSDLESLPELELDEQDLIERGYKVVVQEPKTTPDEWIFKSIPRSELKDYLSRGYTIVDIGKPGSLN